ncbi:MAG: DUF4105 domain-containing protein [Sulfurospirillum sp.]|nr:DUF4105 domain-containing protein [Sulfurospirillum sp.]
MYSSQEDTVNLALQNKLFEKNEWKALLHYDNSFKVTDKKFLASKDLSLENELIFTIKALYDLPSHYQNTNKHAQCKFPARFLFITHELNISKDDFPQVKCQDLYTYEQKAPADKISLIYVSENVKNPSSMMGHTFLKFSGKNSTDREVAHAITFYTIIESANPLTLIYQNTISGMKGMFALQPYKKIKDNYLKKENRNVWEYQLSLSEYRKNLIYYHAWELKDIKMKYYFTSYNCATVIYNMLSLANPKIYEDKKIWITPLDNVKFLYKYDLIKNTQLLPSDTWLIKMLEDTNNEVNATKNFDKMIYDISQYKSPKNIPNERQIELGYTKRDNEDYMKLSFLPASHNLNDYNREYFGESELKIAYLSVLINDTNIELDEFTLYGMKSYMPYSSLTHDLSYQFELVAKKEYTENMKYADTLKIDGGIGVDFLLFNDINIYTIFNGGIGYNSKDKTHVFFNPQIGVMIYELLNMKSLVYFEPYYINNNHIYDKYILQQNIFIHKNYTLYFNLEQIESSKSFANYEFGLKYLF